MAAISASVPGSPPSSSAVTAALVSSSPAQPPVDLAQVRQFAHRGNCEYNDDGFNCTVPAGEYFMMGDNRDQSSDSRYWGFVPDDHVKGRAFLVWMNFGDFKRIGNGIE